VTLWVPDWLSSWKAFAGLLCEAGRSAGHRNSRTAYVDVNSQMCLWDCPHALPFVIVVSQLATSDPRDPFASKQLHISSQCILWVSKHRSTERIVEEEGTVSALLDTFWVLPLVYLAMMVMRFCGIFALVPLFRAFGTKPGKSPMLWQLPIGLVHIERYDMWVFLRGDPLAVTCPSVERHACLYTHPWSHGCACH
jgi:hypothetical protein